MPKLRNIKAMLSRKDYQAGINEIALDLWNKALKDANGDKDKAFDLVRSFIHQAVDGHVWVNNNCYHNLVLHHSNNYSAYENINDNELIGELVAEQGVDGLHMAMTYHAIDADIFDAICEVLAA